MAYADRDQSGNRMVAIVVVAVLLAALGYAFVTGLAYQYVKKVANKMDTFDVAPPPPPPPPDVPPPPPPPDQPWSSWPSLRKRCVSVLTLYIVCGSSCYIGC